MKNFDVVVLGGGPGGYVAAIRASQLGKKVALIEKDKMGGVCLNRGCIPTKALLKSAHAVHELDDFKKLGIDVTVNSLNGSQAVKRAGEIAGKVTKGIDFLMKKNKVEVFKGTGILATENTIDVTLDAGGSEKIEATNIIIATGAKYRSFPGLEHDGDRLIGAWEAVHMKELPKSIGIVGAGAIGVEFAYFWNSFGVDVHIFELQKNLLPVEDEDCSKEIEKAYKKYGIKQSLGIEKITASSDKKEVTFTVTENGEQKDYKFEKGLIAVGMTGNIEGIGLENAGVEVDRGFIKVDGMQRTSAPSIYAIGDVSGGKLLAHAASHEGVIAAEHICGEEPHPLDNNKVAGCTYCQPQVASTGKTERQLKEEGTEYTVGKMAFRANGKAQASNETEGFVKVLIGKDGELLGGHIVGNIATELIHELSLFQAMEGIDEEVFHTVHAHPTLGEWIHEAFLDAKKRALHA